MSDITINEMILRNAGANIRSDHGAGVLSDERRDELRALGTVLLRRIREAGGELVLTDTDALTPHLLRAIADIKKAQSVQDARAVQGSQSVQPGLSHQQNDAVESNLVIERMQDSISASQSPNSVRKVRLQTGAGFSRGAATLFNPLGYAVVPKFIGRDGKEHYKPYKGRYQQDLICPVNDTSFNNSQMALLVVDDPQYHFAFVDCDLHKGTTTAAMVREQFQLSNETFERSVIQSTSDAKSIHLLFRIPADLWKQIEQDTQRQGEKSFVTSIKNTVDSRVPADVEIKIHRQFQQIRLKPGKVLFVKKRSEFPVLPGYLQSIITDVRDRKQASIDQRQQARAAAKPADTSNLNRLQKRKHAWAMTKVDRKVEVIQGLTGDRHNQINNLALEVGHYIDSCQLDYNYVREKLMAAGRTTGLEESRLKEAVDSGLNDGREEYIDPVLKD